jgi:hypothetical protein
VMHWVFVEMMSLEQLAPIMANIHLKCAVYVMRIDWAFSSILHFTAPWALTVRGTC